MQKNKERGPGYKRAHIDQSDHLILRNDVPKVSELQDFGYKRVYYQPHTKYGLTAPNGQNLTTERNTHCSVADSTKLSIQMGLQKSLSNDR